MKSKKISFFVIAFLVVMLFTVNVYAEGSYNVNISANKTNIKQGDTIVISFSLSNISVEPGIGAISGKIEYDKTVFEKITSASITSGNGWATVTYNDQNESEGAFVVERALADTVNTNNVVFEVTFKVLSTAKIGDTQIKLTEISSSTGESDVEISDVVGSLKIEAKTAEDNPTEDNPAEDNPTEDNPTEDNPTEDNPTEDNPTEDNPTEDKPTEDKPTEDKPTEDKPTEDKPTEDNPTEDKPTEDKPTEDKPTEDKPTDNKLTNNNTTNTADKEIPKAGLNDYILPTMLLIMAIGIIAYIRYKNINNI